MVDNILLNPNLAYLFLVGGFSLALMAVLAPGTGLLEIGAFFSLLLAGYAVYNLPINYWAFGFLVLGVFLFIWAVKRSGQIIYLLISILALMIGSAYLFRGEMWWKPAVNIVLTLVTSALAGGFFWIVARNSIKAGTTPHSHGFQGLVGALGEAKTDIHHEGSAQVLGELWAVRSDRPIQAGATIRVVRREGFVLDVVETEAGPHN